MKEIGKTAPDDLPAIREFIKASKDRSYSIYKSLGVMLLNSEIETLTDLENLG